MKTERGVRELEYTPADDFLVVANGVDFEGNAVGQVVAGGRVVGGPDQGRVLAARLTSQKSLGVSREPREWRFTRLKRTPCILGANLLEPTEMVRF